MIFLLFFVYGIYAAATEGITKAWITNIAHRKNTATAIGFYTSCESICTLVASIVAGLIWSRFWKHLHFPYYCNYFNHRACLFSPENQAELDLLKLRMRIFLQTYSFGMVMEVAGFVICCTKKPIIYEEIHSFSICIISRL